MSLEDPLAPAAGEPDDGDIDDSRFRQVVGHYATGVTVVTTAGSGEPAGLAVNSFTSVSLEPLLVAFCVVTTSRTWARIRDVGSFCVNILAEDQEALCRHFAGRRKDKFSGIGWHPAPSGSPILEGVLGWVDCSLEAHHLAGDHHIVVGRVSGLDVARAGRPLVFYRGGYGRFAP